MYLGALQKLWAMYISMIFLCLLTEMYNFKVQHGKRFLPLAEYCEYDISVVLLVLWCKLIWRSNDEDVAHIESPA